MSYEQGQLFEEDELPILHRKESRSYKQRKQVSSAERAITKSELEKKLRERIPLSPEEKQKFGVPVNTFLFAQCVNNHSYIIERGNYKSARKLIDDIMLTASEYAGKYPRDLVVSDLYSLFKGMEFAYSVQPDTNLRKFKNANNLSKLRPQFYDSLKVFLKTFY